MENKDKEAILKGVPFVTYYRDNHKYIEFRQDILLNHLESYSASQTEELRKENEELKKENCHFSAEITYLSDKYAISDYTKIIQDRNKEISDLKYKLAKIKELKDQASDVKELFPLLQYISNNL